MLVSGTMSDIFSKRMLLLNCNCVSGVQNLQAFLLLV